MRKKRILLAPLGFMLACLALGCQTNKIIEQNPLAPFPRDISQERKDRFDAAVREFDERRDAAQYQAAYARWQHNDVAGCIQQLNKLLERSPQFREARLLLAESQAAAGYDDQAHRNLQSWLAEHPDDADAHLLLAVLLETGGLEEAAVHHFAEVDRLRHTLAATPSDAIEPLETAQK